MIKIAIHLSCALRAVARLPARRRESLQTILSNEPLEGGRGDLLAWARTGSPWRASIATRRVCANPIVDHVATVSLLRLDKGRGEAKVGRTFVISPEK